MRSRLEEEVMELRERLVELEGRVVMMEDCMLREFMRCVASEVLKRGGDGDVGQANT